MNPLHGIWRGKKQMQRCARFVHDLLCIMFSKKHNGWQQGQAAIYLVFTSSHESEGMLWAKGLPSVSYLRASECLQVGKAFDETCGSVRNPTSREPATGDQGHRYKGTEKKNKQKPLFFKRGLHWGWFKKPLKAAGFRARLERSKGTVGKGRFIFIFSYFYCLTKQALFVSLKRSIVLVWDKL